MATNPYQIAILARLSVDCRLQIRMPASPWGGNWTMDDGGWRMDDGRWRRMEGKGGSGGRGRGGGGGGGGGRLLQDRLLQVRRHHIPHNPRPRPLTHAHPLTPTHTHYSSAKYVQSKDKHPQEGQATPRWHEPVGTALESVLLEPRLTFHFHCAPSHSGMRQSGTKIRKHDRTGLPSTTQL